MLRDRLDGRPASPFFARVEEQTLRKRYLIATSARSGSTFFCSRIADYGELGFPMEFLNESYISEFDRLFPHPSLKDYERYVAGAFASQDGVFGLKTDWWRFAEARKLGLFERLLNPLDLIVHLRREDFVAQAVSLTLAVETDVWHGRDVQGQALETWHGAVVYDEAKIKLHARNILNQEYYWNRFIAETDVPAMDLIYEDIVKDVDGAIQTLAEAFDLRLHACPVASQAIERARSEIAQHWCERFAAECGDFIDFWCEYRGRVSAA